MKYFFLLLAGFAVSEAFSQVAAPVRRPLILWADANDQDYYGYNNYYYGDGGYYGYGGVAGRGRDWNNYSDGRYENRGNHRGSDRAAGEARGGGGGGRR